MVISQKQLLLLGEKKLKENQIEEANIKARILLSYVLKQNKNELIINAFKEVPEQKQEEYTQQLQEILQGKPIQYIINNQEFMGLNFYVDENVLIPQPDTEILVEKSIELIKKYSTSENIKILDLCTGSGCIAISLAKYIKNVQVIATDISKKALKIAKKNAENNQVENKVQLICSDLFETIQETQFDYIVSNPPYIETEVIKSLSLEVRQEPPIALNGGKDGLEFYKTILKKAEKYLKQNGYLLLEIGFDQGKKIIDIWKQENTKWDLITKEPIKDLGGNDRVLVFQKK